MGKKLLHFVHRLKKKIGCRTYVIEMGFVGIVLVTTAIMTNKGWIERVGVLAVFLTFGHATIADRLQEAESKRHQNSEKITVECYRKLDKYFYAKEICRFLYFVYLGAWSALVGVVIFLCYTPWRKLYRKYTPSSHDGH